MTKTERSVTVGRLMQSFQQTALQLNNVLKQQAALLAKFSAADLAKIQDGYETARDFVATVLAPLPQNVPQNVPAPEFPKFS